MMFILQGEICDDDVSPEYAVNANVHWNTVATIM